MYPENFRYTKEHEWVQVEGDIGHRSASPIMPRTNSATSSMSIQLARETLKLGDSLKQGKSFGSVESVKAVSDIYSPVSGEVIEINESARLTLPKS